MVAQVGGRPAAGGVAGQPADRRSRASTASAPPSAAGWAWCWRTRGRWCYAFGELTDAAQAAGVGLAYSATVCGALPVVNIGRRDLVGCDIRRRARHLQLDQQLDPRQRWAAAAATARRCARRSSTASPRPIPAWTSKGWDTANKLVIIANSILRQPATLADVQPVTGITAITRRADRRERAARGKVVKLVATAERHRRRATSSRSSPKWLPDDDFLASVNGWEMGIVFDTDIMGLQQFKVDERGPVPTAGAMLRDVINLSR